MKLRNLSLVVAGLVLSSTSAHALSVTADDNAASLAAATLAGSSGISIVGGSETYQGSATQGGTYTGFSLSNSSETLSIDDGVVLTSGDVGDIPNNDSSSISSTPGAGSDADLQALSASVGGQTVTTDANVLEFDFTVAAGITSVSLDFIFASDEFPDQGVTDIFGVFVDGVNYAFFPDGSLVSFVLGSANAGLFNDNDFGSADPFLDAGGTALEYDGIYDPLTVVGLLDTSLTTHTIKIAIGDTSDTAFDSGVFFANLTAGTDTGGGIDPGVVPLPAGLPMLLTAMAGIGVLRRRKKAA